MLDASNILSTAVGVVVGTVAVSVISYVLARFIGLDPTTDTTPEARIDRTVSTFLST
jgi:hypothetical protein